MTSIRKRLIPVAVALALAMLLSGAALTKAHMQPSSVDPRNPNTRLDLRRAWLDHSEGRIFARIQTHGGFTNTLMKWRAAFQFNIRKANDKGFYAVHVYRLRYRWRVRIFRVPPSGNEFVVGTGSADRLGPDTIEIAFRRSAVNMASGEPIVRWSALGLWCQEAEGAECTKLKHDYIPNTGTIRHRMLNS
jgi:hypothetical protein